MSIMEMEQWAMDLDWDDDLDESLLDDDFDACAEIEAEYPLGREKLAALGLGRAAAF
jgi:hypothetical protein